MTLALLTETEVSEFVARWYHSLDIHIDLEGFLAMVADEGIEFRFPEVTVTDKAGLTEWYKRVTTTFFDEVHETQKLLITTSGDTAGVKLTTLWQSSTWNAPEPKSERRTFLAGQTWKVKRSEKTGQPVVVAYIVDTFDPVGGSGVLPVKEAAIVKS
jgi:SnoaL-like domain